MIFDLERFIAAGSPAWKELEAVLARVENEPGRRMTMEETTRFHYLYQRCSADLARMAGFSAEPRTREYLEGLVARAYAEIHETRDRAGRLHPLRWLLETVPRTFRRNFAAFAVSLAITIAGVVFGAAAMRFDAGAKPVLMPFAQLNESPGERVKREESAKSDRLAGRKSSFSAMLMTHNIQVTLFTLALGMSWGVGTVAILFYNGVTLGAVAADYVLAGYTPFLFGWLLPHGVIEIPAILVGGQASFVLAGALIGQGKRASRRERLRAALPDLLTLAGTAALMLVWAGIVEAFFSQYHEPVLPYALKIVFGAAELALLAVFLARSGRGSE